MFKKLTLVYSLFLAFTPLGVFAQDVSPDVLEVDSIQPGCKLMVSRYGYNPDDIKKYKMSLNWQCAGKKPFVIDAYEAGSGTPEIVTVFYTKNRDVVALLKWRDDAKDSTAVRYKVFAYRYVGDISDTAFFRLDRLSERFGDGFDGMVNGKLVEYPFKTASAIRKQLVEFGQ